MNKKYDFKRLRRLRMLKDITLDTVGKDTGLSVGFLNQLERGIFKTISNDKKRHVLENYIEQQEKTL